MIGATIEAKALDRLRRRLNRDLRAYDRARREKMVDATKIVAKAVTTEARARFTRRSGRLFRSIRRRVVRRRRGGRTEFIGIVRPGKRAFYGRFHEFGTRTLPRREFLAPAVASTEDEVVALLGDAFEVFLR